MTRSEEIRRAGGNYEHHMLDADQWPDMETDFIHGAEWADEHPKSPWISVKDELPEENKRVFTCSDDMGTAQCVGVSRWNGKEWEDEDDEYVCVDYWMPIPPLKEEE